MAHAGEKGPPVTCFVTAISSSAFLRHRSTNPACQWGCLVGRRSFQRASMQTTYWMGSLAAH
eukprot:2282264-Pyramimonas_sp.AAC.1